MILSVLLFLLTCSVYAQFTNESELGMASANGNTRTQSLNYKQSNEYKWESNVLNFRGRYLKASANGNETARYLMLHPRYERQISRRFGLIIGEQLEKDRFANIDQRLNTDIGGKYRYIETETTKFFSELGYRYQHEDRIDGSYVYNQFGRLYTEWERKWNTSFSSRYWFEYLPNFVDQNDWMFNTEASLSALLTQVFSLKVAFLIRYDHFPAPGVDFKADTLFTTAIVAKF
jgi:putative salt-induced outer membrane protein